MIQFLAPQIKETGVLPESDSAHCCRVLRMREGDRIHVVDGMGHRYLCAVTEAHPKHTAVEILQVEELPRHWTHSITLAVAPTKHMDRMEWLLEKAVEIGVDRVVLLRCRHSERKEVKTDRLVKVMASAMKQSLKGVIPRLDGMVPFEDFIKSAPAGQKFFGYCDDKCARLDFARAYTPGSDVTVLIGPEGDFSPQEVDAAIAAGFAPVTFGNSRLRTETAALFAVTAIHVLDAKGG